MITGAKQAMLGARVDATSYVDAVNRVTAWARSGESRYVCAASMNNIMEAHDSPEFKAIHNRRIWLHPMESTGLGSPAARIETREPGLWP